MRRPVELTRPAGIEYGVEMPMAQRVTAIVIGMLLAGGSAIAGPSFVGSGITIVSTNGGVLGASTFAGFYPGYFNGIGICQGGCGWQYLMYCQDGSYYWYGPTYEGLPLIEAVRREDPELMKAIIGPTMPEPDRAMLDLRARRYVEAATEFLRRHDARVRDEAIAEGIAIPDRSELRLAALALAGAGSFEASAARFAQAHSEDPLLGADPIDGGRVLESLTEARRIVLDAMQFAKRTDTADAWALVGYLMQVQGRYDEARAMLARSLAMR